MEKCDSDSDTNKCYICLSEFGEETVASLDSCHHVFCLQCIHQWSKTANTCPVDRISFGFILPGGDAEKKIKVEKPVRDDDDDDDIIDDSTTDDEDDDDDGRYEDVNCKGCGHNEPRLHLLVCNFCDARYHLSCVTRPAAWDAEGYWFCAECVLARRTAEADKMEDKKSNGEVNDLQTDEEPSTSSRLRTPPLSWTNAATAQRRSQRLQDQARGDTQPLPPTSMLVPRYLIRPVKTEMAPEEAPTLHSLSAESAAKS